MVLHKCRRKKCNVLMLNTASYCNSHIEIPCISFASCSFFDVYKKNSGEENAKSNK